MTIILIITSIILFAALRTYWYTVIIGAIFGYAITANALATPNSPVVDASHIVVSPEFYIYTSVCTVAAWALFTPVGWATIAAFILLKKFWR